MALLNLRRTVAYLESALNRQRERAAELEARLQTHGAAPTSPAA